MNSGDEFNVSFVAMIIGAALFCAKVLIVVWVAQQFGVVE